MPKRPRLGPCLLVGFLLPLASALAQTPPGNDLLAFEDIPEVFTASKFQQKANEAPASITVVTARDIRLYGYRTLGEILQGVRGFYIRDDRNYDSVGVRGFGRPGDYNNRILLLIDGHRLNDDVYEMAPVDRSSLVDVSTIDRVEIVRGPGSSLYGTCGFFAVVNVITQKPADIDGARLRAAFGSFDSRETGFAVGKEIDGVGLLLSGSFYKSVGERDIYFAYYDDPATNNGIAERSDGETAKHLAGKLSFGEFTLQAAFEDREKQVPTGAYDTVFNDPRTFTDDLSYFGDLRFAHGTPASGLLDARVYFDRYVYRGTYIYDYGSPGLPDLVANEDQGYSLATGAEVRWTQQLGEHHRLIAGAELRVALQEDQRNYDSVVYLDDHRNAHNFAFYAQDEWRLREDLIVNAGLRFDHYSTFRGAFSPRLGLIYNLEETSAVKVVYGRAFRAPTAYELYYNDAGASQKENPDLDPETIDTYEVILEQGITDGLRGSLSLFHYDIRNLISQITDPGDGLLVFQNVDNVRANGMELELGGRWTDRLRGRLSYTLQDSEDVTTHSSLLNSPRHVVRGQCDVEFAEHWAAAVEFGWVAARQTPQGTVARPYAVTNVNLLATDLVSGLELRASVKNLFDERYDHVAGGEHFEDVLPDRGRQFWLQASYRF